MFITKKIEIEDREEIKELYAKFSHKEFPLPSARNLGEALVKDEKNGNVIAYGTLDILAEALLILNKDASLREKAESIGYLLGAAKRRADELNLREIYVFIRDHDFAEEMVRHFGFEPCEGKAMVLRIKNGQE